MLQTKFSFKVEKLPKESLAIYNAVFCSFKSLSSLKQKIRENKKMIKEFLDKQCEEKRKEREYERQIDLHQGRIWEQDTKNYYEHEKEVNAIIRAMNKNNLEALKSQISYNKNHQEGMSDNERAMNRDLLEKAAAMV